MFIAALSVIAPHWKEPRCLSMGEWLNKPEYIHTMDTTQEWGGINSWDTQKLANLQGIMLSKKKKKKKKKKKQLKVYILCDSVYAIFLKWKTFTNKEQISDCPELRKEHRGRTGGRYDYRRATGEILVMDSLGLDHGGGYTWDKIVYRMKNTHTHTHTQMSTSKTGEIWIKPVGIST